MRVWQDISLLRRFGTVTVVSSADFGPGRPSLPLDVELRLFPAPGDRRKVSHRLLRRGLAGLHQLRHGRSIPFVHSPFDTARIRSLLAERRPDLIVFDEPWQFPYLQLAKETSGRILHISHNVEALLRTGKTVRRRTTASLPVNGSVAAIEGAMALASDQIWVCSETDRTAFEELYGPHCDIRIVPNGLDERAHPPLARSRAPGEPWTILFPGLFSYAPNAVAAHMLLDDVLPRVRARLGDVRLLLVGKNPTRKMLAQARKDPGITVTGFVESTAPYFAACDCLVAPLLSGSGTRLKLLEAFARRRPVVSTHKGAEGLDTVADRHLLIGESPDELADAVCRLAQGPGLPERIADEAFTLFRRAYSWAAIAPRVEAALGSLLRAAA